MATNSSSEEDQSRTLYSYPVNIWRWLTNPSALIEDSLHRRQARLLATLALALIPLGFLAAIVPGLTDSSFTSSVAAISANIALLFIYGLSRTRYHMWGAAFLVAIIPVVIFPTVIADPSPSVVTRSFFYLSIALFLSNMFFHLRKTVIVAVVCLAGLVVFPLLFPEVAFLAIIPSLSFILITAILIAIATRHRNLVERDRQANLQATNTKLQDEIAARKRLEIELQQYAGQLKVMVEARTTQLRQTTDQLQAILNSSSDAILLALTNGDILQTNPAFDELFGYQVKEAVEQLLWTLDDLDHVEMLAETLLGVIYDGETRRVEIIVKNENGVPFDADVALAPVTVMDNGDRTTSVVLSLRDITHLKEINRIKTRFVADAAHDLANPIATLKLHLYALKRRPDRLEEYLEVLESQTERLERLVEDLHTLSRLDRGMMSFAQVPVDLNDLVRGVVNVHGPMAETKQQTLTFDLCPDPAIISGDWHQCERVVVNLVENALNYTLAGGQVTVTTQRLIDSVCFIVADTGIGIAEADLPRIFERFFRGEDAEASDVDGTGLGLAIVHEIVKMHGGRIEVESVLGEGSNFRVFFPAGR